MLEKKYKKDYYLNINTELQLLLIESSKLWHQITTLKIISSTIYIVIIVYISL